MRCFVATMLVLLATVFCSTITVGCSSVGSIEKRQIPLPAERSPDEPCTSTELQRRNDSLRCNNAAIGQQLLDVFASCGFNNEAQRKEEECGRNETGGFCYEQTENNTLTQFANSVVFSCTRSAIFCSFSCNSSLQQLRQNTGCCANFLLTDAYLRLGRQRNPDLWSNCGLQRPDNCQSSLSFTQTQNDVVCSGGEITYRLNRLNCNPDYATPFVDLMRSCGLGESAQIGVINRCGVTRYDTFCFEAEANASRLVGDVRNECFTSAQECPISCKVALDMYRTGADCCLNNLYNNSQTATSLLRTTNHMLWSSCGISSPGFCRNTVDSSSAYSVLLQISATVTWLSAIFAIMF